MNDNYVIVTEDPVGQVQIFDKFEKPIQEWSGKQIMGFRTIQDDFKKLKYANPNITAIHVLASSTPGENGKEGVPSDNIGQNIWIKIKNKDKSDNSWIFVIRYGSVECALNDGVLDAVDKLAKGEIFNTSKKETGIKTFITRFIEFLRCPCRGI